MYSVVHIGEHALLVMYLEQLADARGCHRLVDRWRCLAVEVQQSLLRFLLPECLEFEGVAADLCLDLGLDGCRMPSSLVFLSLLMLASK